MMGNEEYIYDEGGPYRGKRQQLEAGDTETAVATIVILL